MEQRSVPEAATLAGVTDVSEAAEQLRHSLLRLCGGSNDTGNGSSFDALKRRETEAFRPEIHRRRLLMRFVPNAASQALVDFDAQLFCGKFNKAGNIFLSASQDAMIRLYSVDDICNKRRAAAQQPPRAPRTHRLRRAWLIPRAHLQAEDEGSQEDTELVTTAQPYRTIACRDIGWSIISTAFSPDDQWLIYSSWSNFIHLCNLQGEFERHEGLEVNSDGEHFCLFSTAFSPNATHVIGGSNDRSVYVYNLEAKQVERRILAHDDDVNAVCYLDASGQVLLSGSDDSLIKVWDLRQRSKQPQGVLSGHLAGITSLAVREDGMTIASNSKDQSLKIWDVRKMLNGDRTSVQQLRRLADFDYRFIYAHRRMRDYRHEQEHPQDASIYTFTGHSVLATLIRCDFSPLHYTGQRYVYSGDAEARVFVWDLLTGERVRVLRGHSGPVRDVSWHPYLPMLASSSWDCTVRLWGFNQDQPKEEAASLGDFDDGRHSDDDHNDDEYQELFEDEDEEDDDEDTEEGEGEEGAAVYLQFEAGDEDQDDDDEEWTP